MLQVSGANGMEKQERVLINQWCGPAPSLDVAGKQEVDEGLLARYWGGGGA